MIKSADWLAEIEDWVGTPYHHQQKSRYGCDCIGLLIGALRELGVDYSDFDQIDRPGIPRDSYLEDQVLLRSNACDHAIPGSVILFYYGKVAYARHIGVALSDQRVIHASRDAGKVIISRPVEKRSLKLKYRWLHCIIS